jgi:hypothetical protein
MVSAPPQSVSSDLGKLDVSRHFTSGIDWAIAGLAMVAAAAPAPIVARNCRRFMFLSLEILWRKANGSDCCWARHVRPQIGGSMN